jgi:hypothetical protein
LGEGGGKRRADDGRLQMKAAELAKVKRIVRTDKEGCGKIMKSIGE